MHGRVKVRTTAEQEAIKQVERAKKVELYKAALNLVFQKRNNKVYDEALLKATERMVLQNPDINTIWNIRREAFENNKWIDEKNIERFKKELTLTEFCLRENPKSYSAWHQRCWIIDNMPEPDWKTELELCSNSLDLDERNFHCWDYRKHLVKKAGISDAEEFKFSTTKIFENFSNYSSWHYRSKILSKMFPDESKELPINADNHKEELDLVLNATFTDPNDSSAWFYQRWLLDYSKPQSNTIWCAKITNKYAEIIFHSETSIETDPPQLFIDDKKIPTIWTSFNNKEFSKLWIATFPEIQLDLTCIKLSINFRIQTIELYRSEKYNAWIYKSMNSPVDKRNKAKLKEQMESYKQLTEIMPNHKWALLTRIFLMNNLDLMEYHDQILKDFSALIEIDNLRSNYYADMRSKYIMDYKLHTLWKDEKDNEINCIIDLSGLNLTVLYNEQYFSLFEEINLSGNHLEHSLHRLEVLQKCKKLSLSCNNLETLKNFPTLKSLEFLSLRNNQLSNSNEILDLIERHNFVKLDLRDNPFCNNGELKKKIFQIFPDLELQID